MAGFPRAFLYYTLVALFLTCPSIQAQKKSKSKITKPTLGWRNGDSLKGKILPSTNGKLTWHSDAFVGPFILDQKQLKSIEFPESYLSAKKQPNSQFRITFLNGDRLFGDLLEISPDTVTFLSPRLVEPIVVKRSFLNRIERISGSHLRYSGPTELEQWKPLGRDAKDADWYQKKSGEFVTHRWGGEMFRKIPLPEKVEISFSITAPNARPNIEIGVTEDPETGPRIETWDDMLVLTSGNRFEPILQITEKTKQLNLRLFWNQEEQFIKVCDANGRTYCELTKVKFNSPKTKEIKTTQRRISSNSRNPRIIGFRLLNRSPGIQFGHLSVREWDGKTIPKFDASQPRIEMTGGQILFNLQDLVLNSSKEMRIKGEQLPFEKVDQFVFSTERQEQVKLSQSRLAWNDGGIITGEFNQIDNKQVKISPPWFKSGLTAALVGAKELYFPETTEPVLGPVDTIKSGDLNIGGVLTPGINGASHTLLSWKPIGSENASPLAADRKAEITREAYPGATESVGDARIYLTNEEVIAGKLISIDEAYVEFSSHLTGKIRISTDNVRAVDIEGAGLIQNGFVDKGWTIIDSENKDLALPGLPVQKDKKKEPDVVLDDEKVVMRKGGFGHLNLLVGDCIRYRCHWKTSNGIYTIRLFCSDFSKDSPSTDVLIGAQNNRILVGKLKQSGGFTFSPDQVTMKNQQAEIMILAQHDKVEIHVNGKKSQTIEVDPDQVAGNGIAIQMGGGWRGWNESSNTIEFSDFSIDRSPGVLPKRIINTAAKERTLTVPRFHREDPPTHVLVAANGDLLRGKLRSAKGEMVQFVSRKKEMEIPRSRVSAIIWLRDTNLAQTNLKEGEKPPEKPKQSQFSVTHQLVLHNGTRLNLTAESIEAEKEIFSGYSEILGLCKVPISSIRDIEQSPPHFLTGEASSDHLAYSDWFLKNTPDPAIPKGDGSEGSPLIGKEAPDFDLPLLSGGKFKLSQRKGRVVVLDFWATWCGPCIKGMPDIFRAMSVFRKEPVDFCAVNQAETAPIITQFLEKRGWAGTTVGLDFNQSAGLAYGAKSIPHTVVIGKDGKIAWVHTGYAPDLGNKLANAVGKALAQK